MTNPLRRRSSRSQPAGSPEYREPLAAVDVLGWSVWFGLCAGLCEVGTRVVTRTIDPAKRMYTMSRHFVWLTPLANVLLFFSLGLILAVITRSWPRLGAWLSPRLLCALALLPMFMVAAPAIFPAAWFVFALGISSQLVPWLELRPSKRRLSLLIRSLPVLLGSVLLLAGSVVVGDGVKQRLETSHAFPPSGSPNVLLIVLDTVRADHLSLEGYGRPTTPTLERLARIGNRFDRAGDSPMDAAIARQLLHRPLAA